MKILKNIITALLIILGIVAVGLYFMPKEYSVSNSIEINKPVDVVYAQVSDFSKWNNWSPWKNMDTTAQYTYEGTPGMKGHKMSWKGAKSNEGSMAINWSEANKSVHSNIDFILPREGHMKDEWQLEADGNKTKVTWTNSGGLKYPDGRLFGMMVNKMMDEQHIKGLNNLKKYCESLPAPQPVTASTDSTATTDKSM